MNASNIPAELCALPQWVVWREVVRDGKRTKPPYRINGQEASSTNPATWTTFEKALRASLRFDGIGFVFTKETGITGIDLDECVQGGVIEPWAQDVVNGLDSYAEFSPTGTGIHVFVRADQWHDRKRITTKKGHKHEIYDCGRFFTITGDRVPGTPATIEPRQTVLDALLCRLFEPNGNRRKTKFRTEPGFGGSDSELIAAAHAAKNGPKFSALWRGEWKWKGQYESQSNADAALCSMLAFYTGRNADRMDGLFGKSGLADRTKWQDRPDYRKRTIENACRKCREVYTPPREPADPLSEPKEGAATINPFTDNIFSIKQWVDRLDNRDYILEPLLRRGELAFLYGPPKAGKTFVVIDALFAVCLGNQWCGKRYAIPSPRNVILAIGEGQHGLKARLEAASIHWETTPEDLADRFRVVPIVPNLYHSAPDQTRSAAKFVEAVESTGLRPDLLVIDTYSRATLGAEENSNRDAALILDTLQRVQARLDCAALVVHHSSKAVGDLRGASAVLGAADVVLKCSRDGRMRRLEVELAKDIPEQPPITFDLFPTGDTGSCSIVWGEQAEDGGSLDERILGFLKRESSQAFTAREIGEAVGTEQKNVMPRLWALKSGGEVKDRLRNPDRLKSSSNPLEWRRLSLPNLEAEK